MINIPISAIPNQSLSILLNESQYDLTIKSVDGVMAMDVIRDNLTILTGQRVVAGFPVIPYRYLEAGNFVFITEDDDYPDYTQFGITQSLIFATEEELAIIRAGT